MMRSFALLVLSTLILTCYCQERELQTTRLDDRLVEVNQEHREEYATDMSALQIKGSHKNDMFIAATGSLPSSIDQTIAEIKQKNKNLRSGKNNNVSTESDSNKNHINKNTKELRAVIHIGPMKTGSSAIQSSLFPVLRKEEDSDNYEDAGRAMDQGIETYNFMTCFKYKNVTNHDPGFMVCNPKSLDQVRAVALERNRNLIVSAEYITSPTTDIDAIKKFIEPLWKKQTIVAFYRRYYDWLVSFHNEGNKRLPTPDRQPLNVFLENESKRRFWWGTMYIVEAVNRWKQYFDDITIINMYEQLDGDVREQFYCQALPDAKSACAKFHEIKHNEVSNPDVYVKQRNPSMEFVYQDLAYFGSEHIKSTTSSEPILEKFNSISLSDISHMVKDYNEKTLNRTQYNFIPESIICPSEDALSYLYMESIDTEKMLFPDYFTKQGQQEIMEEFAQDKTTKLCHIDATIVVQNDPIWKQFFQSLVDKL